MTAMLFDFRSNPRYQRIIQRIGAMRPEQRAILNSAAADTAFGNEAMRKYLASLSMAADEKYRNRALGIEESKLNVARNLAEQEADIAKKQTRIGTGIAAANIPISGYFGMKQMDRDKEEAAVERQWRKDLLAKYEAARGGA